jgi:hypothetical protein
MNKLFAFRTVAGALAAASLQVCWAAGEIPLQFAWPDGLRATVHQTKSKTKEAGTQGAQTTQVAITYPMAAARNDQGLAVTFGKLAFEDKLVAAMTPAERAQFETMTQAGLPSVQVSPTGEFLGIHDLERFRSSLRAAVRPMNSNGDANLERVMEQFMSEPVLVALASNDWNLIVGNWAGSKLEPGATYRATSSAPFPLVAGVTITMVSRYSLVRSLPCTRAGITRDCVELEMNTAPDPADMAAAIKGLMKNVAPGAASKVQQLAVKDLEVRTSVRLVTERSTLVPHGYTYSRSLRMTVNADGKEQASAQEEQATVRYSYEGT